MTTQINNLFLCEIRIDPFFSIHPPDQCQVLNVRYQEI